MNTRLAWLLAACVALAGCRAECPRMICPRNTIQWHALGDSTVTWMAGDSTAHAATGFVSSLAGSARCSLRILQSLIFATASGGEMLQDGYLAIDCTDGSGYTFGVGVNHIGDVRDWSVGTFTVTAPELTAGYEPASGSPPPNQCDGPNLEAIPATVTVEIASGGPLPLPKMVTDDFARTFWFDFDIPAGRFVDLNGVPCDFPVTAHVSLHLTQTAADYVHDPNAICGCG